ncbi:DNA polymerase delta subunit 3 [Heracleum sosnowskyi]|uniref:DNA polymerase delta subunit 3 n=1 Tax=Heracleum sosnowskyi TaxID=360622 RepID=A0AAD8NCL8_9APIA|nr:DNA polymerase delta subunit 3 [Heracleum sosnowskyi]
MAEVETLGILDDVESLVCDNLQVVSYKWLSRNFLVSSNAAKRLLQEFVEKKGSNLEVVYTLSGWLKNDPSVYHIRLASRTKLGEAKQEFDDNCSVQVYSVQTCIPKDSASLWNAEFIQAEELFKQAPTINNCLRDNRLCRISNSFVKRNVEETHDGSTAVLNSNSTVVASKVDPAHKTAIPQPQQKNQQQISPHFGQQSSNEVKNVNNSHHTGVHEEASKPATEREKVLQFPVDKKKDPQNNKVSSGTGGSLATMWGRVSAKPKPVEAPAETSKTKSDTAVNADAKVCAGKTVEEGSSDDDDHGINFKRASNGEGSRKRRVFIDSSDEEDDFRDAVSLASPGSPKVNSSSNPDVCSKAHLVEKSSLDPKGHKERKLEAKEENDLKKVSEHLPRKESVAVSKSIKNGMHASDKAINHSPETTACSKDNGSGASLNSSRSVAKGDNSGISSSKHIENRIEEAADVKRKVSDAAPSSPKRRKVLKTRIDERGREVSEVVWEGDELEGKDNINAKMKDTAMKASNSAVTTNNRPPAPKKSPAVGLAAPSNPVSKAGNKKGGKDPKQGNILSFFKKV